MTKLPFNPISIWCWVILSVNAGALIYSALTFQIISFDPYWLLDMGRQVVEGEYEGQDRRSFTYFGKYVAGNYHWFGTVLYGITSVFGIQGGAMTVRTIASVVCVGIALWLGRSRLTSATAAAGICLVAYGLQYRFFLRPEIFDYVLMAIGFFIYARSHRTFNAMNVLLLWLLLTFWCLFHAGILAYVFASGLFTQWAWVKLESRAPIGEWVQLTVTGCATLLLGFVSDLGHPIIAALLYPGEWSSLIVEHNAFITRYSSESHAYFVWPVVALVSLAAAKRRQFGLVVILLLLSFAAWERVRMLSFLSCASGFCLVLAASEQGDDFNIKRWINACLVSGFAIASMVATVDMLDRARKVAHKNSHVPKAITSYLSKHSNGGNIVNALHYGGWLVYSLGNDFKVHIDGRTIILYPLDHMKLSQRIALGDANSLLTLMRDHTVNYILFPNRREQYATITLATDFRAEVITEQETLYSTEEENVSVLNLILNQPMCWSQQLDPILIEALALNHRRLKTKESKDPFSYHFFNVSRDAPQKQYDEITLAWPKLSSRQQRAIAYRAMLAGDHLNAAKYFIAIVDHTALDILTGAFSAYEANDYLLARRALLTLLSGYWDAMQTTEQMTKPRQLELAVRLAQRLETQQLEVLSDEELKVKKLLAAAVKRAQVDSEYNLDPDIMVFRQHCAEYATAVLDETNQDLIKDMATNIVLTK